MTFEKKITAGNIIEIILIVVCIVVAFVTVRERQDYIDKRVSELQVKHAQLEIEFRNLEVKYTRDNTILSEIRSQLDEIKTDIKALR